MKTAMQELIECFYSRPEYDKTSEGYEIMEKAKELLEKEKEQIIAFTEWIFNHRLDFQPTNKKGMLIGLDMKNHFINDLLIEYHNQTCNI